LPAAGEQAVAPALLALADAARATFTVRELSTDEVHEVSHGRAIATDDARPGSRTSPVAAISPDGSLVALLADERGRARPVLVLAPA
ncbi:MAG TPA: tRNA pseudouridine(55) synthase TruB, partial [Actinotalea sp.]|nr:tRNA pseudouridine(55) synthase TruB [Actinotalea sp.]